MIGGGEVGGSGRVGWSFSPLLLGDKSSAHTNKIEMVFIINIFAQSVVSASEGRARENKVGRGMEVLRVDLQETETHPPAAATIFTSFCVSKCASVFLLYRRLPSA